MRVRVARIVAAAPPIPDAPGNGHRPVDVRGEGALERGLRDGNLGGEKEMKAHLGSDGDIPKGLLMVEVPGAIEQNLPAQFRV